MGFKSWGLFFISIIFLVFSFSNSVYSQNDSTIVIDFKEKLYYLYYPPLFWQSPIVLNDNFIDYSSLKIFYNGYPLKKNKHFFYNKGENFLFFNIKVKPQDSVLIYYKTLGVNLKRIYTLQDSIISDIMADLTLKRIFEDTSKEKDIKKDTINISGYKGFYVDINNNNFYINQDLELKIKGKASDSIYINGYMYQRNLSDNTYITEELEDIDKLYFNIYTSQWNIMFGDISVNNLNNDYTDKKLDYRGIELSLNKLFLKNTKFLTQTGYGFINKKLNRKKIEIFYPIKGPYYLDEDNYIYKINVYYNGIKLKEYSDFYLNREDNSIYLTDQFRYYPYINFIEVEYYTIKDYQDKYRTFKLKVSKKSRSNKDIYFIWDNFYNTPLDFENPIVEVYSIDSLDYGAYIREDSHFRFIPKDSLNFYPPPYYKLRFKRVDWGEGDYIISDFLSNGEPIFSYYIGGNYIIDSSYISKKDDHYINIKGYYTDKDSIVYLVLNPSLKYNNVDENKAYAFIGNFYTDIKKRKLRKRLMFDRILFNIYLNLHDSLYTPMYEFEDKSFLYKNWRVEEDDSLFFYKDRYSLNEKSMSFFPRFKNFGYRLSAGDYTKHFYPNLLYSISKLENSFFLYSSLNNVISLNMYNYDYSFFIYNKKLQEYSLSDTLKLNKNMKFSTILKNTRKTNFLDDSLLSTDVFSLELTKKSKKDAFRTYLTYKKETLQDQKGDLLFKLDSLTSILSGLYYKKSINKIDFTVFFERNLLKIYTNYYKIYNLKSTLSNNQFNMEYKYNTNFYLVKREVYVYVGNLRGDWVYDSLSSNYVYVGESKGNYIKDYIYDRTLDKFSYNKSFLFNYLNYEFSISPLINISLNENSFDNSFFFFTDSSKVEDFSQNSEIGIVFDPRFNYTRFIIFRNFYYSNHFDNTYSLSATATIEKGYRIEKKLSNDNLEIDLNTEISNYKYKMVEDTLSNINRYFYENKIKILNFSPFYIIPAYSIEKKEELLFNDKVYFYSIFPTFEYKKHLIFSTTLKITYRYLGNDSISTYKYIEDYIKGYNYDITSNIMYNTKANLNISGNYTYKIRGDRRWQLLSLSILYYF